MRFILGFLLGYCLRGRKPLLVATLSAIATVCFIVLPVIALSQLAISVRRERLSRPPQTSVPVVVGLNRQTAEMKLRAANLNMRILANRRDLPLEPGLVVAQTPQGGEHVDCGTVVGVTMRWRKSWGEIVNQAHNMYDLYSFDKAIPLTMKKEPLVHPLDHFPFPRIGISYFAEQAYCEKRVELWLRNPGNLVSVPAEIDQDTPEAKSQEELASRGKEFHESMVCGALSVSASEVEKKRRAGQSITLAEPSFQGDYDGLPLIGRPDAILFEGMRATSILEYKVTDSDQLYRSHRVQLLLYGYLIAQNFDIDNLVLICVLVPRRHSKWLDKLTPAKAQRFVEIVSTKAAALIASQPSRKNWHCLGLTVHRDIRVHLRVFKYDQEKAENELEFFTRYWRGEREAMPTTKAGKCAACLYNLASVCSVPQVSFGKII
jgi:PD-(D/E)XK nuclease superfamily protein/PASTA domain-containing protein